MSRISLGLYTLYENGVATSATQSDPENTEVWVSMQTFYDEAGLTLREVIDRCRP